MSSLTSILSSVPFYAVWVVACVLAGLRWSKHPTASALVVTGGVLQILASLARVAMPMVLRGENGSSELMWVGYGLAAVVSTAGLGCLVCAVFSNRPA